MNIEIEQAKTFSLLTEKPCFVNKDNKYIAFAGYVLPSSVFKVFFMWAICGQNIYNKIFSTNDYNILLCKTLNSHDKKLQDLSNTEVGTYFSTKFKSALQKYTPDDILKILDDLQDPFNPIN